MRLAIAAALALTAASTLSAQDLAITPVQPGSWSYSKATDGSEAVYLDASSTPQLWLRCTHLTRQVAVSRPAAAAAPAINVWTSTQSKAVPATFDSAARRVGFSLWAFDPLFDAMAFSRGRIGFSVGSQTALVVPPWEEVARVIEDCRA